MLKLFQQRKETIKNKHISLLKVRKGTKRETKTTRNGNIDTKKQKKNGGLWVKNTDILKNLRGLTESQKIEAVKYK